MSFSYCSACVTRRPLSLLAALLLCLAGLLSAPAQATPFEQGAELLKQGSLKKNQRAVELIAESEDPRALSLLLPLQEGQLYLHKPSKTLVLAESSDEGYQLLNALTGESMGTFPKRALKKIPINNRLRTQLKGAVAMLQLSSPDPALRLQSLQNMLVDVSTDHIDLLTRLQGKEQEPAVLDLISVALALAALESPQSAQRVEAANLLGDSLQPEVRNRLVALQTTESDKRVLAAINDSLARIEQRAELFGHMETLYFGLSLGSVLVLAAIGLAITFGVMGVINMAHGELIMLGAYTTYVVQQLMPDHIEYSLLVAVPAAFMVSALVGIAIERGVIRFLYGRPLETLLATFGISLILQQAVRTIFSPLNRSVETPAWMSGALEINSLFSLTYNRLYIILFCLLVFAALFWVLKKTRLGLQVRAVSQNREMARAMGVRSQWVDAMTFGLGSGVAGVAGVALSQLTNVGPNLGQAYIIDSFMVVVFGGVGNLWGTLVAGLFLGIGNKVLEPWSGAVLAKILMLIFIILFIQKRPRGLFPQKGRAAEN
ncbi:urea ABC transporter permease subunit UrtB [Aestuariirhabdus litorea]|uniref:Urea ABC transporter permease subunit UrtB n=1 Tax=Aestuariirhabdus litorea TaxID=2528527 RepID=A0A3P3VPK6_9GAMM|nr:urea ABC transporter permease subunit UrtB [Aestuariirhabdus litorea]RRJ84364.1 urea ABC transporter permease subunit UrtB [Aestuariirhabdus litorea]RWW97588.1 urea ABC transporter permease subunit UrtB [Endozoicomonadaceae bacterium GTF-13]